MFESTLEKCLLVQVRQHHCIVAVCEQEKLVRAAAIDWEGPQTLGTLAHDLLNLLETLDAGNSPSFYITGPQSTAESLCERLAAAGKTVRLWTVSNDKLQSVELTEIPAEILHCPEAAGIALAALEEEPAEFDLIRRPKTETTAGAVWDKRVLIRGLGFAAAVLVLFFAVLHWTAQMEVKTIEQALAATHQDTTGQKILARQQMRERIAAARPDMSYLMTALNTCVGNDVLLDSFSFKKGQPIRIVAKTGSFERVYTFQKKVQEQAGISDVKLISPTMDEKKKQVQFTITFAYRSFSR
jgi:hypothetical protein